MAFWNSVFPKSQLSWKKKFAYKKGKHQIFSKKIIFIFLFLKYWRVILLKQRFSCISFADTKRKKQGKQIFKNCFC